MNLPTWALTARKNEERGEVLASLLGILDKPAYIENVGQPTFMRNSIENGKLEIIATAVSTYQITSQAQWDALTAGKKVYFYSESPLHSGDYGSHVRMFLEDISA